MKFNKYIILFLFMLFPFFIDKVSASTLDSSNYYYLDYENINLNSYSTINNYNRSELFEYLKTYIDDNNSKNYYYSIFNEGTDSVYVFISSCPFNYSYYFDSTIIYYNYNFTCDYVSLEINEKKFNNSISNILSYLTHLDFPYSSSYHRFQYFKSNYVSKYGYFTYYSNFSLEFVNNSDFTGTYYDLSYNGKTISVGNFIPSYFDFINNIVPEETLTFSRFLDILSSVCSFFLDSFLKFCDVLINNWFILVIVGFGLFVSVIWIAFDIMDISFKGLFASKKSIDDYLDKEADKKLKIREAAEKELIMRQNYEYNLQKSIENDSIRELIRRQNYEYNLKKNIENDSIRELTRRQNWLQVFDPDTDSIVYISDSSQISNLKFRNYKYHSHGVLDNIVLKKTNIPDIPIWFDKEPQKLEISPEEELELKILLKGISDSDDDKNDKK